MLMGVYSTYLMLALFVLQCMLMVWIHIGVGFWLLVLTDWALPEPPSVGRVTVKNPALFSSMANR